MSSITTATKQALFQRFAACRDEDPELFFPVGTGVAAFFQAEEARFVCFACPLLESCADGAMTRGEEHGVWGRAG
jgi:WhiB family redox-sensing transcriptional regulator